MDANVILLERQRLERAVRTVLRASRQYMDVSQKELAQKMGWSRNQVANLESGRRAVCLADFVLLAGALKVDPISLLQRALRW